MELLTLLIIAVALAMDAFAVSIASGVSIRRLHLKQVLKIAFFFGIFQGVMPVLGWAMGRGIGSLISGVDHWIAFCLLVFIGARMIHESLAGEEHGVGPGEETEKEWGERRTRRPSVEGGECREIPLRVCRDPCTTENLIILAVATSIDAFGVGLSLSLLGSSIILPALIIGLITFCISFAGVHIGNTMGHLFERKIEIAGGVVLILIGLKILLDHMYL